MPLTRTAVDLLDPAGRVEAAMFPSDTEAGLAARLLGYLTKGYNLASALEADDAKRNDAAEAYAYHRVWDNLAVRFARMESSATVPDQGSRTRTDAQRQEFKQRAGDALAEYEAAVAGVPPASALKAYPIPDSAARQIRFVDPYYRDHRGI